MNSSACWRLPLKAWAIPPRTLKRRSCLSTGIDGPPHVEQDQQIEIARQPELFHEEEFLAGRVDIGDVEIEADFADRTGRSASSHWRRAARSSAAHDVERVNAVGSDTAGIARHRFTVWRRPHHSRPAMTMVRPCGPAAACTLAVGIELGRIEMAVVSISIAGRENPGRGACR